MTSQANGKRAVSPKATVAANLKVARLTRGLKQRELAALLDVDVMQVSKWERGIHTPDATRLAALASVFGRDIAWFYTEHKEAA